MCWPKPATGIVPFLAPYYGGESFRYTTRSEVPFLPSSELVIVTKIDLFFAAEFQGKHKESLKPQPRIGTINP